MVKEKMIVNPWEVKGELDYDKLVKEFGVEKLSEGVLARIKKHTTDT